jgi:hypothetical protein
MGLFVMTLMLVRIRGDGVEDSFLSYEIFLMLELSL